MDIKIHKSDLTDSMQNDAILFAKQGFQKSETFIQKNVAKHIKLAFDNKYEPVWHCVVGNDFGSYTTHQSDKFIYFSIEKQSIILFKT